MVAADAMAGSACVLTARAVYICHCSQRCLQDCAAIGAASLTQARMSFTKACDC